MSTEILVPYVEDMGLVEPKRELDLVIGTTLKKSNITELVIKGLNDKVEELQNRIYK